MFTQALPSFALVLESCILRHGACIVMIHELVFLLDLQCLSMACIAGLIIALPSIPELRGVKRESKKNDSRFFYLFPVAQTEKFLLDNLK